MPDRGKSLPANVTFTSVSVMYAYPVGSKDASLTRRYGLNVSGMRDSVLLSFCRTWNTSNDVSTISAIPAPKRPVPGPNSRGPSNGLAVSVKKLMFQLPSPQISNLGPLRLRGPMRSVTDLETRCSFVRLDPLLAPTVSCLVLTSGLRRLSSNAVLAGPWSVVASCQTLKSSVSQLLRQATRDWNTILLD